MNKSVLDYTLKIRLPITIFVIILTYIVTFYASRAERTGVGYQPEQPINFSHKLHAGQMKIDCEYCHTGVGKGRHAMIPSTNVCMNCHAVARKNKPQIKKITKYHESSKPIPWKRIHKVPEYAYFNHSVHVNTGIKCQTCHGDVEEMEKIKQVKPFNMAECLDCHRNPKEQLAYLESVKKGPDHCAACHR